MYLYTGTTNTFFRPHACGKSVFPSWKMMGKSCEFVFKISVSWYTLSTSRRKIVPLSFNIPERILPFPFGIDVVWQLQSVDFGISRNRIATETSRASKQLTHHWLRELSPSNWNQGFSQQTSILICDTVRIRIKIVVNTKPWQHILELHQ